MSVAALILSAVGVALACAGITVAVHWMTRKGRGE